MKVTAVAQRVGKWWAITVPEVADGIHTQARRLDQVAEAAAGAVADVLEIPVEDIEVEVAPALAEDVEEVVRAAREASAAFVAAQVEASTTMRRAVAALLDGEELTTRDAAVLLGVSQQRITQLSH